MLADVNSSSGSYLRSAIKGNCRNLIENLLKNDAVERLPMKPGGVKNLTGHKWFSEFDWDALTGQAGPGSYHLNCDMEGP